MSALLETAKISNHPSKYKKPIVLESEALWKKLEADPCSDEPPEWHEAIVEERYKEWTEGKITSRNMEEVFKELKV